MCALSGHRCAAQRLGIGKVSSEGPERVARREIDASCGSLLQEGLFLEAIYGQQHSLAVDGLGPKAQLVQRSHRPWSRLSARINRKVKAGGPGSGAANAGEGVVGIVEVEADAINERSKTMAPFFDRDEGGAFFNLRDGHDAASKHLSRRLRQKRKIGVAAAPILKRGCVHGEANGANARHGSQCLFNNGGVDQKIAAVMMGAVEDVVGIVGKTSLTAFLAHGTNPLGHQSLVTRRIDRCGCDFVDIESDRA